MKKVVLACYWLVAISSFVPAQESLLEFAGVGSNLGNSSYGPNYGKNTLLTPMQSQLEYLSGWAGPVLSGGAQLRNKDQVIIGHSQGGLRALAWAGSLYQNFGIYDSMKTGGTAVAVNPSVKAVFTIGAPNVGLSTLLQGPDALSAKVQSMVATLIRSSNAVLAAVGQPKLDPAVLDVILGNFFPTGQLGVASGNPFNGFFQAAGSIPDMTPGSSFINDNVVRTITYPGYWVTTTEYLPWYSPWFGLVYYPSQKNYFIQPEPTYISKLNPKLLVGQIRGGNKDIITAVAQYLVNSQNIGVTPGRVRLIASNLWLDNYFLPPPVTNTSSENEYNVRMISGELINILNAAADAFHACADWYGLQAKGYSAAAYAAYFFDYQGFLTAQRNEQAALGTQQDLWAAYNWVQNIQGTWDSLLGNSTSDSLIAAEDAVVPLTKLGGTVGDLAYGGTFLASDATHISETWDKDIWGGTYNQYQAFPVIQTNCVLDRWLTAVHVSNRSGVLVQ